MNCAPSLYLNYPKFNELFKKLKNYCEKNNINTKKYVLQVHLYYQFMEYEIVKI